MSASEVFAAVGGVARTFEHYSPSGEWLIDRERELTGQLVVEAWDAVALPEHLGGGGGTLTDAVDVAAALAALGHLTPLADSGVVSVHAAALVGLELPTDRRLAITADVAGIVHDGRVTVSPFTIPFARWARSVLVPVATGGTAGLALIDLSDRAVSTDAGRNLSGEPRDTVRIDGAPAVTVAAAGLTLDILLQQIRLAGALARSIQITAAVDAMVALCVRYVSERHQFGRPLSAFQAVQQMLAGLAGEALAGRSAVDRAVQTLAAGPGVAGVWPTEPIAVARSRAGRTATDASAAAHQLHGAIGITREYPLHRLTRPVWGWREEYGNETEWAAALTAEIIASTDTGTSLWNVLVPAPS